MREQITNLILWVLVFILLTSLIYFSSDNPQRQNQDLVNRCTQSEVCD